MLNLLKKLWYLQNKGIFPSGTLNRDPDDLGKLHSGTSTDANCRQQSTDYRPLFITLSVQLHVPRDGRDTARRADPSAAA